MNYEVMLKMITAIKLARLVWIPKNFLILSIFYAAALSKIILIES